MPAVNAAMDAKVIAVNSDAVILVSSLNKTSKKGLIKAANILPAHYVRSNPMKKSSNKIR